MGVFGPIGTASVCPYPYTFDDATHDALQRNASLEVTADDCTQTFAERLDPGWAVSQGLLGGLMALVLLPSLLRRLWQLRRFTRANGIAFLGMVQARLYLLATVCATLFCLLMVDPAGYRGLISPYIMLLVDELVAASCCALAVGVIDWWASVAKGGALGGHAHGLPMAAIVFFTAAPYVLLFGVQIVAMADVEHYFVWSGSKQLIMGTVLSALAVVAWLNVSKIERFLTSMNSHRGGSLVYGKEDSSKDGSESGRPSLIERFKKRAPSGTSGASGGPPSAARIVAQLRRKYRQFFVVVGLACLILFVNGALQVSQTGKLEFDVNDTEEVIIGLVQKCIYFVAVLLILLFFAVPKHGAHLLSASSSRLAGSSAVVNNSKQSAVDDL